MSNRHSQLGNESTPPAKNNTKQSTRCSIAILRRVSFLSLFLADADLANPI
jgi:hypothetical protein